MFPADAGMNRESMRRHISILRVPRRRGDEPEAIIELMATDECSPQTRG